MPPAFPCSSTSMSCLASRAPERCRPPTASTPTRCTSPRAFERDERKRHQTSHSFQRISRLCFFCRNPVIDDALEEGQRQRSVRQYLIVELAQLEARAERLPGTLAQLENFQHAGFVRERLSGRYEIALDFGGDIALFHTGLFHHVRNGLLAAPMFVVD